MASSFLLLFTSMFFSYRSDWRLFIVLALYFLIATAYSLWLKNVVILDVLAIAAGFLLRTIGGTIAIGVPVSFWLMICTALLALFLALNKRKGELSSLAELAAAHRSILGAYTAGLLDQMLAVVTSSTLLAYSLYVYNSRSPFLMMFTLPFVLYGIFRYQYLADGKGAGGSPETLLIKDKPLMSDVILWIALCMLILAQP
jgi:4-hydroxybenzoate polyprenyltransferase